MSRSEGEAPAVRPAVRPASSREFARLRYIETEADKLFLGVGIGPFPAGEERDHLERAELVLAVGEPAVGFACAGIVDGAAHLWQVSVLPSAGRKGLGSALVEAVCEWARGLGLPAVTLTTFRDVPWNGPWYRRLGFEPLWSLPPGLAAIRQRETDAGDDRFGPRVAMRREIRERQGPAPAASADGSR